MNAEKIHDEIVARKRELEPLMAEYAKLQEADKILAEVNKKHPKKRKR